MARNGHDRGQDRAERSHANRILRELRCGRAIEPQVSTQRRLPFRSLIIVIPHADSEIDS
jgi:hypothetical protein